MQLFICWQCGYLLSWEGHVNILCVRLHMAKVNSLCKEVLTVFCVWEVYHHVPFNPSHSRIPLHPATKPIKFPLCKFWKNVKQLSSQRWEVSLVELLSSPQGSRGVSALLEAVNHELVRFPKSHAVNWLLSISSMSDPICWWFSVPWGAVAQRSVCPPYIGQALQPNSTSHGLPRWGIYKSP